MLRVERLSGCLRRVFDPLGVALYLLEGNNQAALFDTGHGFVGLRAEVEALTSKPVTVFLTHGHFDHAPGIFEFGEAYLNARDHELFWDHANLDYRLRTLAMMYPDQTISASDLQPATQVTLHNVGEGKVLDLGGVTVEAYPMPGHTPGSVVYLFPQERTVLFGDAIGPGTLMVEDYSTSISEYLEAMLRFQQRHAGRYDLVLRNHGTCWSKPSVLDNAILAARNVLAGTDACMPLPSTTADIFPHPNVDHLPFFSAEELVKTDAGMVRADGLEGNINYRLDKAR